MERGDGWQTRHFVGHYRAIATNEVAQLVERVGFKDVAVHPPHELGLLPTDHSRLRVLDTFDHLTSGSGHERKNSK